MALTAGQLERMREHQADVAGTLPMDRWLAWEVAIQLAGVRETLVQLRDDADRIAECAELKLGLDPAATNGAKVAE